MFNTIELLDTDGSALNDLARQDSPVLLAPVPDLVAMFDDDSVYRLTSESLRQVRKWQVGDSVLIHPSTSDVSEDSFLTRIDDWLSLPADFVGFAERLVLTTLSQSILSATQAKLSDGTTWEIASADEFKLIDWNDGDNMALVRDPQSGISNLTHTLINLANGDAVAVKFVK